MPVNRELIVLHKLVLGRRIAQDLTTPGGLHLPDGYIDRNPTNRARVLHIGNECEYIQVGDEIVFAPHQGADVEVDGRDYLIINEELVLAIIRETEIET